MLQRPSVSGRFALSALVASVWLAGCASYEIAPVAGSPGAQPAQSDSIVEADASPAAATPAPVEALVRRRAARPPSGAASDTGQGSDQDVAEEPQVRDEPIAEGPNRPYTVRGKRYVPMTTHQRYKARGSASWYGRYHHGLRTANGERYDMRKLTAAHPTLPIPSYARITSLKTGQSVVVRINDRGPFHRGRLIDLSRAAARRLGIASHGVSEVEVEALNPRLQAQFSAGKG